MFTTRSEITPRSMFRKNVNLFIEIWSFSHCFVGVMIYFGYGMWNSSLELIAREEEAHASSYQRYDAGVDDSFRVGVDLHAQEDGEGGLYQGWAAEERGYQHQNQDQDQYQDQYQNQYQNYQQ